MCWVYGYGLHIVCTQTAFPTLMTVQSASVSESWVIDQKASEILTHLSPKTLTADDAYTQAESDASVGKSTRCFDYACIAMDKGKVCPRVSPVY